METALFGSFPRGTLNAMLQSAYRANTELTRRDAGAWKEFDDFVYDNLAVLERCGFVSVREHVPVGFVTWDPRGLPAEIKIGHNCILPEYRGRGWGREQMALAMERMKSRRPEKITVITGTDAFFAPARAMYAANGLAPEPQMPAEPGCIVYSRCL